MRSVMVKAADKYSARPGYSEHQTGLTFDVGGVDSNKNLYTSFGKTEEGRWIAKNAHNYGFIIRYPKTKKASQDINMNLGIYVI